MPRRRRPARSGADRAGWAWLLLALALVVDVALALALAAALTGGVPALVIMLAAAGVAVLLALMAPRWRRLAPHFDRALTVTVTVTSATIVVAATTLVLVGAVAGDDADTRVLWALVAAGVAVVVHPYVVARLRPVVNQLVYGRAVAPGEALARFGSRLTRALPLDELLLQLAELLRRALRLQAAEVWVRDDGHLQLTAGVPHRRAPAVALRPEELTVLAGARVSGDSWIEVWLPALHEPDATTRLAPLVYAGDVLGVVICRRARAGDAFSPHEDAVLAELARQVSLALHNARLDNALQLSLDELQRANRELRASRARLVAAGDDERRKLERDLHDGAQQHLVALSVKLRLIAQAAPGSPEAGLLLEEVRHDVGDAIDELRALAHGIFPPLLAAGGLAEALPAAARRAPLRVVVDLDGVGRYPPEVEAAVYFCCVEALQNAAKHAGPGACATLTVRPDGGALAFEVADDGAGFDPVGPAGTGHGFVNMVDRLGAIDGVLTVDTAPGGGTRVRGGVPLP